MLLYVCAFAHIKVVHGPRLSDGWIKYRVINDNISNHLFTSRYSTYIDNKRTIEKCLPQMVLEAFCLIPALCILIFSKAVRKLCLLGDDNCDSLFCVCLQNI